MIGSGCAVVTGQMRQLAGGVTVTNMEGVSVTYQISVQLNQPKGNRQRTEEELFLRSSLFFPLTSGRQTGAGTFECEDSHAVAKPSLSKCQMWLTRGNSRRFIILTLVSACLVL